MRCHIQHEPLEVEEFAASARANSRQLRNHFELVNIKKGSGDCVINWHRLRYLAGGVFLLGQIADELALTDVCHLNKLFRKHFSTTSSNYHRHLLALPTASV
ncbi:hypothetical protein [Hymenobacter volaticus]|uniref:AraC family transcriptional regulator n=1 Tax=Hymenobacter volaticus TaxID=2932254 RepID=A0ABY4GBN0_9BACT|nr:hypothetical protein [Hymenobacter volaticus]UOQ68324.1 hypothetical protein MUN86_10990 [Hymenobacter volaticus]